MHTTAEGRLVADAPSIPKKSADLIQEIGARGADKTVKELQDKMDLADLRVANAFAKNKQLNGVRFTLMKDLNVIAVKIRDNRLASYEAIANEHRPNFEPLCKEVHKLQLQRDDLAQALTYLVTYSIPDAAIEQMDAEIEERNATGRLLGAQAMQKRVQAIEAGDRMKFLDPGIVLKFDKTVSEQLLRQSRDAYRQADAKAELLAELKTQTEKERDLAAPSLFN